MSHGAQVSAFKLRFSNKRCGLVCRPLGAFAAKYRAIPPVQ